MKKRSKYLVILAVLICLVGCSGQGYHKDLEKNPQWIDVQNGKTYYARDDGIYQINEKGDTKCLTEEYTTIFTIVQNDLFYFKNRVELWKKDINNLNEEKIIDDCFQFAIVGSEIYFSTNDFKHIYKTTVDGGEQQLVYTVTKPYIITDMEVRGKYIYMTQIIPETGIDYIKCIRIHVETCEEEEYPQWPIFIQEDNNWFYYIDVVIKQIDDENGYFHFENENILYKMNQDGSERIKIMTVDSDTGTIGIVSDWIVYANAEDGNKLYRIKEDGTLKECISEDSIFMLSIQNGQIYYETPDDMQAEKELYRIEVDGSGKTKIY